MLDRDNAPLVAVHIFEQPAASPEEPRTASGDIVARVRGVVSGITEQGLAATARVVDHIGQVPAHGIADVAREVDADAIVVGTRGH